MSKPNIQNLSHQVLNTPNGKLSYYTNIIDTSKETILMLHPAFGDHRIFEHQVTYFGDTYNLILINLPGHGKSYHKDTRLNQSHVPKLIHEIITELEIPKVHILGVSLGSLIGQGIADQYPDIVHSVTVVGGYSIHKDNSEVMKAQRGEMLKWAFYLIFSMKKFREYVVGKSASSPASKKAMSEAMSTFNRSNLRCMNGMNLIMRKTDEEKTYPLLALCGESDLDIAKTSAEKLGDLNNGTFKLVENAGHCANIDNPDVFNKLYEGFISTLSISIDI